jgi:hypothetical protein
MADDKRMLARHVTVGSTTYGPGDNLPDDIAVQIRNPKAWLPVDEESVEDAPTPVGQRGTAGGARLATPVTVGGVTYHPDDPLPDDVAAQIRNPKAWVGGELPAVAAAGGQVTVAEVTVPEGGDGWPAKPAVPGSDGAAGESKAPTRKATGRTR